MAERPTPPLTTVPCEIDWKTKTVNWTKPWWNYFDALQRQVDVEIKDSDILEAFGQINRTAVEENPALAAFLQSAKQVPAQSFAFPSPPVPKQDGLQSALIALAMQRKWSEIRVIQDTFANRQAAACYPEGSFFRSISGASQGIVWMAYTVSGTRQWLYVSGVWRDTLASIPTASLGTSDALLVFEVTDYDHILQWTGSAWTWGPGEVGSGFYQLFETTPSSIGALSWQICDGSTVARLNADGTTTNVTVPDVTTAAYLKAGITAAAVAAAGGVTASVSGGTPSGTVSAIAATATAPLVSLNAAGQDTADNLHTHPAPTFTGDALAGHTHGPSTLELRNKQAILYYRR